eukprot:scaffold10164_cov78-Skeletonema_dohrnii-CCMP3373.AAC.1
MSWPRRLGGSPTINSLSCWLLPAKLLLQQIMTTRVSAPTPHRRWKKRTMTCVCRQCSAGEYTALARAIACAVQCTRPLHCTPAHTRHSSFFSHLCPVHVLTI